MSTQKIYNDKGDGFVRINSIDKVENVNPIKFYKETELKNRAVGIKDLLNAKNPFLTHFLDDDFFIKKAMETLEDFFEKFENTEIPENFIKLLSTSKKYDQVKLMKRQSLNTDQLMALIFKSYSDFGYLYSRYTFENLPNGYEDKKLPKIFHLNQDGTITKIGETDCTDGELKHIIEFRTVIASHFLIKDEIWHCLFLTFKSLNGEESWKEGQAHFHYISSGFGVSKDDFIDSMRTGKYKSSKVHIDLLDYGNQTNCEK